MSGSSPTTTVTNESSRAFQFGETVLLPHIPQDLTDEQVAVIKQSTYGTFFTFAPVAAPPPPPPPETRLPGRKE